MSFDDVANVNADAMTDGKPLTCVVDDFSSLDMARWYPYTLGPTLQVTGGELVITPAPNAMGYAGLNSREMDFTGGNAAIEVPLVVGEPNVENYLLVFVDNDNYYAISYDGGRMHYYRREARNDLASTDTYSAQMYRYWLIGHDAAANEVYFWAGPTRMSFAERYRVTATVPVTSMKIELAAGSYATGTATPGQARFDNFQLCLP